MKQIAVLLLAHLLTGCAVQTGAMVRSNMPVAATVVAAVVLNTESIPCKVFNGKGSAAATGAYLSGHNHVVAVRTCQY